MEGSRRREISGRQRIEKGREPKTSIVLKLKVAELFLCGSVIDPCNKSVFESFLMNEPT